MRRANDHEKCNIKFRRHIAIVNDFFKNLNEILKKRRMSLETKDLNTRRCLLSYIIGVAKCYNMRKCNRNAKRADDKINAT